MVFEVLSPKQGKQFHFFACGKGVSRLSRLFGKESLNYMCGINKSFLFENLSLDGVPTPCPNFRLGPPSPAGFLHDRPESCDRCDSSDICQKLFQEISTLHCFDRF